MLFISIVIGAIIGFMLFRVLTATTAEKRRDWLAVGAVTIVVLYLIFGWFWTVNTVFSQIHSNLQTAHKDPSEMPVASIGGGKTVEDDYSVGPYLIREDRMSPPTATEHNIPEPDPAIANDPPAGDFDPNSI